VKRLVLISAVSISTASCFGGACPEGRPVPDVYHEAAGGSPEALRFLPGGSPLARQTPVPVIYPPEIFPVYVPTHVDVERDMMVGDHYLFIKLRDSMWLSEKLQEPDPPAEQLAPEAELLGLRQQLPPEAWDKILVPYREKP